MENLQKNCEVGNFAEGEFQYISLLIHHPVLIRRMPDLLFGQAGEMLFVHSYRSSRVMGYKAKCMIE